MAGADRRAAWLAPAEFGDVLTSTIWETTVGTLLNEESSRLRNVRSLRLTRATARIRHTGSSGRARAG